LGGRDEGSEGNIWWILRGGGYLEGTEGNLGSVLTVNIWMVLRGEYLEGKEGKYLEGTD